MPVVLNFHGVGPVRRKIDSGENNCWLDCDSFCGTLDLLRGRPDVKITVDDGNASDFEIILPELIQRGMKATFFVCSGRLDQPTFLERKQVRELSESGMGIGSHGVNHVPWRNLPPHQLREELQESRKSLEDLCQISIESAACPFGLYDRTVLDALRQAGYQEVYTSDGGAYSESQWVRARTTVTRSTGNEELRRLIADTNAVPGQWKINVRKLIKRLR